MRIGTLAVVVAGVGLLTSCKVFDPKVQPTLCSGSSCTVNVAITVQTSPSPKCDIKVDPEYLDVSGALSPKKITWPFAITIDGKPFPLPEGTQLPIKFDSNADGVIKDLTLSGNTVSATYYPPSSGGHHHYGYSVILLAAAKAVDCKLDPWVVD